MREELRHRIEQLTRSRTPWRPVGSGDVETDERVTVSTQGLCGLHELWPRDLVARVGAGCTLASLERQLGAHGLTLGIDAPCPDESTLGGIFARAESGLGGAPNHSLRARVLGLTAIDGQARLLKAGARVVKNVAGYDLARLHHGARGAFGIVLDFSLRLSARPQAITHWALDCPPEDLLLRAQRLRRPQAARDPERLVWLDARALQRLGLDGAGLLIAEFHDETPAPAPGVRVFDAVDALRDVAVGERGYHLALPLRALSEHLESLRVGGFALRADLLGGAHVVEASRPEALRELALLARAQGGWLIPRTRRSDAGRVDAVAQRLKAAFDPHDLLPPLMGPLA